MTGRASLPHFAVATPAARQLNPSGQVHVAQVGIAEVGAVEIDRGQVEPPVLAKRAGKAATAKHPKARLHVRRPHLQLWHLLDRRRGGGLVGQPGRPGGMGADKAVSTSPIMARSEGESRAIRSSAR